MRISRPAAGSRVPLDEIDLADIDLYTSGDAHLAWQTLRAASPVFWHERAGGEGFWAVTRWHLQSRYERPSKLPSARPRTARPGTWPSHSPACRWRWPP